MGFIKSIFGIVGGLFKAILGVFGIGKKSEFFMEIEEDATPAATPAPAEAQAAAAPMATSAAPVAAPAPKPVAQAAAPATPAAPVPSFAASYLTGPTMPRRRRPGPSLSPFKDMAKQMGAR